MPQRILVYDRFGQPLTEFEASTHRVWVLGEPGMCEFCLPLGDPKVVLKNLQYGNLILVEDDQLPPWIGVIDTPRAWDTGIVKVTAYGGLHLLDTRYPLKDKEFDLTAGTLFEKMIRWARSPGFLPLRVGHIYAGGKAIKMDVKASMSISKYMRDLRTKSGYEFTFTPAWRDNHSLIIEANWHKALGYLQTRTLDEDNTQLMSPAAIEQGTIINRVIGEGSSQDPETRIMSTMTNDDSVSEFGLRIAYVNFYEADNQSALNQAVKAELDRSSYPRFTFSLRVMNHNSLFRYLDLGNVFPLRLSSVGFEQFPFGIDTHVRLVSIALFSEESTAVLVADEVKEVLL